MKLVRFVAAGCLLSLGSVFPLFAEAESILPRVVGDFRDGEPSLSVAPGEKRFTRSALPGDPYRKHPYNASGARPSLKSSVQKDDQGRFVLVPKSPISSDVFGALNLREGTISGWFRIGGRKDLGPILSARGGFMESYPGDSRWELGSNPDGTIYLRTPAANCETSSPVEEEWVFITAVWNVEHGVRLYINGQLASESWRKEVASTGETSTIELETKDPIGESAFKVGASTGEKMASLADAAKWEGDRAFLDASSGGRKVVVTNESGKRFQMRTRTLATLYPGRYEMLIDVDASGTPEWNARLSVRSGSETRLVRLSAKEGAIFPFEITEKEGESKVMLDLNFTAPGRYEVRDISLRPAKAGVVNLAAVPQSLAAQRMVIHTDPAGGLRDLRVYDVPLSAKGVLNLFEGKAPETGAVELTPIDLNARRAALGWTSEQELSLPKARPGQTLLFRQAPVLDALENRRAAGWLGVSGYVGDNFPWSYHGYSQGVKRELNLELGFAPNWVTGSAEAFHGSLRDASGERPFAANGSWFAESLTKPGKKLTFTQKEGKLSQLAFYEVSEAKGSAFPKGSLSFPVQKSANSLPELQARELISTFATADRQTFATFQSDGPAQNRINLPALTSWHLVSAPMKEEYALGGIALRLRLAPQTKPSRLRVVIHDPYSPLRELARVECVLEPSRSGEHTVQIDLRDGLLLPGSVAWVSLTLDNDAKLLTGKGGSELALLPAADPARAAELWKAWELRSVRDRLERLSEPRPWAAVGADGDTPWWLAGAAPVYEEIDAILERLRKRFPKDPTIDSWYAFTHPNAPSTFLETPLPEVGNHPQWAVLTRECLLQYRAFLDYWIDKRQLANGELGHFYGDDTDLVMDWLDMTLIADPKGKYAGSLDLLARNIATTFKTTGGRDGPNGNRIVGRPLIENGLNVRWTDVLHAYEDGLNVQPPDFIAHYGEPMKFQRLLDTVARYDGFVLTPEQPDGSRWFPNSGKGMGFINTTYLGGSDEDKYWHLMLHAGLVSAWYNNDPATWSLLEAVAKGTLLKGASGSAESLLQAVFRRTGDPAYLEPLMDRNIWKSEKAVASSRFAVNNVFRLPGLDREATLRHLSADSATRYAEHSSTSLGWGDDRHLHNWLEWQLSGEEDRLLTGLRALYREMVFFHPVRTLAEQSGDRISPPKQLVSQLYLGGVPGSRNRHFQPDFAVSYRGLDDQFAARVEENTPKKVRVKLYSFADAPTSGELRVWALEPGEYRIIRDGDEEKAERRLLRRGEGFPITLPSQKEWTVSVEQISRSEEPALLADAAVSAETIQRDGSTVRVPVYNLGTVALENVTVQLKDGAGKVVAEEVLKQLPGVTNWKLGTVPVSFDKVPEGAITVEVDAKVEEITKSNNQARLLMP